MNAISVQHLGKKFKMFPSPGGRFLEYLSAGRLTQHTDFWALQDINFEIPTGTTLGILGQNGSGKSTLLSILAGVLEPSAGSFEIKGKVSAILELGSGFHPEFSGRDNVYMYGSIMGLSKQEIDDRFDEIVRFSELGDFIDQPLRTYSTGMTVRLAFSVAVNVNADILIVDEALAVGDAIFQHRCFRKIREMQKTGKTILYVGHDVDAVQNLCNYALLLDGGRIIECGEPKGVVNKYFALISEREKNYSTDNLYEFGTYYHKEHKIVYNFIENLKNAKKITPNPAFISEQQIEIKSAWRKIIIAHPPSEIQYNIPIEDNAFFAFAISIIPTESDKIQNGVKFDIELSYEGITKNVFSRILDPKRNQYHKGWHNFKIGLSEYTGKDVCIKFTTSVSGDDPDGPYCAWGWPKIIKPETGPANTNPLMSLKNNEDTAIVSESCEIGERYGNKKAEIIEIHMLNKDLIPTTHFSSGDLLILTVKIRVHDNIENNLAVGCTIKNRFTEIYGTNSILEGILLSHYKKGDEFSIKFSIPLTVNVGVYSITAGIAIIHSDNSTEVLDRNCDSIFFRVNSDKKFIGVTDLKGIVERL